MKVELRACATAKVLAIIAATLVLSGCAMAMLSGAARSGGQSGGSSAASVPAKPAARPASQVTADNATSTAVKSRLAANASLRGFKLAVDTHDGVVTLRGQVNNVEQRNAAQLEARAVKGVKAVKNELTVTAKQ
jgi:hyperosmotically inducible periplasmic protein